MYFISWNINGIRAAYRNGVFDWFKKNKPDFFCLQEIKAKEKDLTEEIKKIPGYKLYLSSAQKPGYSGTAIYTKHQPKKIKTKIGIDKFDQEGRFLLLEYDKYIVFNTYFPHTQRELTRLDYKLEFNQAYFDFIEKLNKNKIVILTGDYNVAHQEMDLANPQTNHKNAGFLPEERAFVDQLEHGGWVDTFRKLHPKQIKYTWWTYRFNARARNKGWRIDYFFVREKDQNKIIKANIHDKVMGSDHCPISLEIKI